MGRETALQTTRGTPCWGWNIYLLIVECVALIDNKVILTVLASFVFHIV